MKNGDLGREFRSEELSRMYKKAKKPSSSNMRTEDLVELIMISV